MEQRSVVVDSNTVIVAGRGRSISVVAGRVRIDGRDVTPDVEPEPDTDTETDTETIWV